MALDSIISIIMVVTAISASFLLNVVRQRSEKPTSYQEVLKDLRNEEKKTN